MDTCGWQVFYRAGKPGAQAYLADHKTHMHTDPRTVTALIRKGLLVPAPGIAIIGKLLAREYVMSFASKTQMEESR